MKTSILALASLAALASAQGPTCQELYDICIANIGFPGYETLTVEECDASFPCDDPVTVLTTPAPEPAVTGIIVGGCAGVAPEYQAECLCTYSGICPSTTTAPPAPTITGGCAGVAPEYQAACKCAAGTVAFCATTTPLTTSTLTRTNAVTISACPPTVVDCPYTTKPLITYSVVTYTTVCPVTTPAPAPITTPVPPCVNCIVTSVKTTAPAVVVSTKTASSTLRQYTGGANAVAAPAGILALAALALL